MLLMIRKDKDWKFTIGFSNMEIVVDFNKSSFSGMARKGLILVGPRANGRLGESRWRHLPGEKYCTVRWEILEHTGVLMGMIHSNGGDGATAEKTDNCQSNAMSR